jgi:hypothetical protein
VQNFSGEFRYNLIVDSGHEWVRGLGTNTKLHHNLFIHASNGGGVNSGIWLYKDSLGEEKNVSIYNNTFDGGAPSVQAFAAPVIDVSTGCGLASLCNNIFTGGTVPENWPRVNRKPIVSGDAGCIAAADYNCFFNPNAGKVPNYLDGLVTSKVGEHDVNSDPGFTRGGVYPFPINQADVWNRTCTVSQVLAYYRARYAPAPGSPVLNGGDPANGKNSYIGAIGAGTDAADLFGKFGDSGKEKRRK